MAKVETFIDVDETLLCWNDGMSRFMRNRVEDFYRVNHKPRLGMSEEEWVKHVVVFNESDGFGQLRKEAVVDKYIIQNAHLISSCGNSERTVALRVRNVVDVFDHTPKTLQCLPLNAIKAPVIRRRINHGDMPILVDDSKDQIDAFVAEFREELLAKKAGFVWVNGTDLIKLYPDIHTDVMTISSSTRYTTRLGTAIKQIQTFLEGE